METFPILALLALCSSSFKLASFPVRCFCQHPLGQQCKYNTSTSSEASSAVEGSILKDYPSGSLPNKENLVIFNIISPHLVCLTTSFLLSHQHAPFALSLTSPASLSCAVSCSEVNGTACLHICTGHHSYISYQKTCGSHPDYSKLFRHIYLQLAGFLDSFILIISHDLVH